MEGLRILAFAGSLRELSYNRALLRAALELAPADLSIEVFDLRPIPLYDGDVEAQGLPPSVVEFKQKIEAAHGLLIVTPEYNRSIPGVLKNAIDWASRPPKDSFPGKPVAVFGGSDGGFGTVRAQLHLKEILGQRGAFVLPQPEVYVSRVQDKMNPDLTLNDEQTKQNITLLLETFTAWLRKGA